MTAPRFITTLLGLACLPLMLAADLPGQMRASPRGAMRQTIDATTITLDYGRPSGARSHQSFRGRSALGQDLDAGRELATTIDVDQDITINGHALGKGTYSIWLEVQPEQWTAIFDPEPRRFHLMPPPESGNQLRFSVHPETGPFTENFDVVVSGRHADGRDIAARLGDDHRVVRRTRSVLAQDHRRCLIRRALRRRVPPAPTGSARQ